MTATLTPPRVPEAEATTMPVPAAWPLRIFIAMFFVTPGGIARAQDLDEQEEPAIVQDQFELDESIFQQWVFGNGPRLASIPQHLDSLLMLSIVEVERSCSLSDAQKRKLLLAGHGDIKRFVDRVAEARKVFDRLRRDQGKINEIRQETQPLAAILGVGLFGDGSFFAKTLGTTLDPEQAARYRGVLREKGQFRYRAKVSLALANLDTVMGFTTEQYRRFVDVILEETTPPKNFAAPYETNVVLLKIARLPEAKIRPIFDEIRWKTLSQQLQQARGMEQFLRTNGLLEEAEPVKSTKPGERAQD